MTQALIFTAALFMTATNSGDSQLQLQLHHMFEKQKINCLIDECGDLTQMKEIARKFLDAFFVQKVATEWAMRQSLATPSTKFAVELKSCKTASASNHLYPL